jgi:hypothetical protein
LGCAPKPSRSRSASEIVANSSSRSYSASSRIKVRSRVTSFWFAARIVSMGRTAVQWLIRVY